MFYNKYNMLFISGTWLQIAISFAILLPPLLVVYGIQEKNKRVRHITITFSAPDGSQRAAKVKIGFSWTIFLFKGWALLFRGQFLEFLALFFIGGMFAALSFYSLAGFQEIPEDTHFTDLASAAGVWDWIGYVVFLMGDLLIWTYYILFGNRMRLRKMVARGYKFDNGQNENVEEIYKYLRMEQKTPEQDLKPGMQRGDQHDYVVPDAHIEDDLDSKFDYSNLTTQDMKLLLKSEKIPFSAEDGKEELLSLINEFIAEPARKAAKQEIDDIKNSEYINMTIAEIVAELDKRKLWYKNSMRKNDLVKILVEDDKK